MYPNYYQRSITNLDTSGGAKMVADEKYVDEISSVVKATARKVIGGDLEHYMNSDLHANKMKQMKQLFVDRRYLDVFTNPDFLAAYFCNYVPTRALCYLELMENCYDIREMLTGREVVRQDEKARRKLAREGSPLNDKIQVQPSEFNVTCIGAGAGSEFLAFKMYLVEEARNTCAKNVTSGKQTWTEFEDTLVGIVDDHSVNLTICDIADWSNVCDALESSCDEVLNDSELRLRTNYVHADLLDEFSTCENPAVYTPLFEKSKLITFMFVLNELFATSKRDTVTMLQNLIQSMTSGSMLLVVESAGSFSEIQVGSSDTPFMVYKLLDGIRVLDKIDGNDAQWFRYDKRMEQSMSPLPLNNMRYFWRIYKKID